MYQFSENVPKYINAYRFIVWNGLHGVTELDLLDECHVISGRNYLTEIEREAHITLRRRKFDNVYGGQHSRYYVEYQEDMLKAVNLANRKYSGAFTKADIIELKRMYPKRTIAAKVDQCRRRLTRAVMRLVSCRRSGRRSHWGERGA
ncbi:hypothetical protein NDW51_001716 [Escherichia coli]|nr:hypothetical protein [Escherichia coli]